MGHMGMQVLGCRTTQQQHRASGRSGRVRRFKFAAGEGAEQSRATEWIGRALASHAYREWWQAGQWMGWVHWWSLLLGGHWLVAGAGSGWKAAGRQAEVGAGVLRGASPLPWRHSEIQTITRLPQHPPISQNISLPLHTHSSSSSTTRLFSHQQLRPNGFRGTSIVALRPRPCP
ncbi:hypothetical protein HDK90DRAFT_152013 [Phyllosticta capitalensis]|uniref:Uncharacterized protein n=1 Tax=Phyllosticta capitalensis TaxID=121624 RepID=A0ABR1Z135_9PEZI